MLFVALLKVREGAEEERIIRRLQWEVSEDADLSCGRVPVIWIIRRLQWEIPEGLNVLGEYYLMTPDPEAVIILEADDFVPVMQLSAAWNDVFEVRVYPAVAADEVLDIARRIIG